MFVESYGTDRYGQIFGVVWLDQTNVNLELVKNGYAEVYRGKPAPGFNNDPYWQAETLVKSRKLKFCSLVEDYVSPME